MTNIPDHPFTYSKKILERLRSMLAVEVERVGAIHVLDPFAGVGTVHRLADKQISTVGVEIQKEWAVAHPDTICGSVMELPLIFPNDLFDGIVTSPSYGNRGADHHNAQERCSVCRGSGEVTIETFDLFDGVGTGPATIECEKCSGKGIRDHYRNTYTHALRRAGVEPVEDRYNSQIMPWGPAYQDMHVRAWNACDEVLRPGGLVLLNVKNHIRGDVVQRVVEFHLDCWFQMGYMIEECRRIETRGLAYGANWQVRTAAELVVALRKPTLSPNKGSEQQDQAANNTF